MHFWGLWNTAPSSVCMEAFWESYHFSFHLAQSRWSQHWVHSGLKRFKAAMYPQPGLCFIKTLTASKSMGCLFSLCWLQRMSFTQFNLKSTLLGLLGGSVQWSVRLLVSPQVTVSWFPGFKPHVRLWAGSTEPAWDSLSLPLSLCPSSACAVSLSQ